MYVAALGESDHGCVRPAAPQVGVSVGEVLDALPVGDAEAGCFRLPVDDGRVQAGFGFRAGLPAGQAGGLRDDHGGGDQGTLVALRQGPAGSVVAVGAIGGGDQGAGIGDQRLIAPELLGQHFIGFCPAAARG